MFPNDASVIRLVGAVLADMHDERQAGDHRYLRHPDGRVLAHAPRWSAGLNTGD
jgi:transposase-like protein